MASPDKPAIEQVLDQQGRSMAWLARKANVSVSYAWLMLKGQRPLTAEFKTRSAEALGVPEAILFPAPGEAVAS